MKVSKDKLSSDGFEKLEITRKIMEKFRLPEKSVGMWAIIAKINGQYRLRKIRLDGFLASDKGNNHQGLSYKIVEQIISGVSQNNFELEKITSRKVAWINALIEVMKKDKVLSRYINKVGEEEIL